MSSTEFDVSGESLDSMESLEQYTPFVPFESSFTVEPESLETTQYTETVTPSMSPFVSEYEGGSPGETLEDRELHQFLFDLYDREFEELVGELTQEAAAAVAEREGISGEGPTASVGAEAYLEEWIAPLREQADAMMNRLSEAVTQADVSSMTELELNRFFEQFEQRGTGLEPLFEDFLGGLLNKAKRIVSGAVTLAKKGVAAAIRVIPGLSGLLGKLKGLIKPLLNRVLRFALNRLPPALRGPARMLAQRVLGRIGVREDEEIEGAATPDLKSVQRDFDLGAASLLFAADEAEQEEVLTEIASEDEAPETEASVGQLMEARERFVDEVQRGHDPQQALEQFIPAILPVARIAIRVVGRGRVVNFLAGYLSKLIAPYVGTSATPLSRAIVDAGLRLLTLEAPSEIEIQQLAPEALAATVEDTVRRVAEAGEGLLEDPVMREVVVQQAFFEAAAENFPSEMLVPEAQEAPSANGTWVAMPLGRGRKYYHKYTRVFDVAISNQAAASIRTFGGVSLAAFLKGQVGASFPVRARLHLYKAIPGTWLSRIAKFERVPGLGSSSKVAWSQIHPMTPRAAATLLKEPRLGRPMSARFLTVRDLIGVGQRLYYLEIVGARHGTTQPGTVDHRVSRPSEINVTFDFPKDEYRVDAFLSERKAQEVAAKLRRREIIPVLASLGQWLRDILKRTVETGIGQHVKINTEASEHEEFLGLGTVGRVVLEALVAKLADWCIAAIGDYLRDRSADFINAADATADGVTVTITIVNPPGAAVIRKLIRGEGIGLANVILNPLALFGGIPRLSVQIAPGFRS
jgi:hypothetical protein